MGNSLGRTKNGSIDGGAKKQRLANTEYDQNAVYKLIINRKLAPFYEGLEEALDSSDGITDHQELEAPSLAEREDTTRKGHKKKTFFKRHLKQKLAKNDVKLKRFLADRRTNCPICFLVSAYANQFTITVILVLSKKYQQDRML